jgi:polyisoprenoid-binding protein YceI
MKSIKLALATIILFSGNVLFAKKLDINTEKSTIEWTGEKITGKHMGTISIESGFLDVKKDMVSGGKVVINMNSITNTDIENEDYSQKLVGHLKDDDFFGVEKYPTAEFVIIKGSKFVDGKASITGELTIKGITETISFEIIKKDTDYLSTLKIDRTKFGIRYGSNSFFDNLGDKAIYNDFTLDINLVLK